MLKEKIKIYLIHLVLYMKIIWLKQINLQCGQLIENDGGTGIYFVKFCKVWYNEISSINENHCAKVTDVCSLWREWFRLLYDSLN